MLLYYIRYARKKIKFFIQRHAKKKFLLYHLFPFNTIKVRLKDEDAHELHNICEMLDKHGIRYRLTDGVALGFYREHHFIRHDTDLDFDLMDFDSLETLKEQMKNRGYKIGREVYYDSQIQQIVFYNKNQLIVDFSIWYRKDNELRHYGEKGYVRIQELQYFENLTDYDCYGYTFKLPGHLEEWLVKRFGEDWRIPKTYKGDWKQDCLDIKTLSVLSLLVCLFLPVAAMAEASDSSSVSQKYFWAVSASGNYSYLIPKGSFFKSAAHSYGVAYYDLRVNRQINPKADDVSTYDQSFNYPTMEFGLSYGDFNHIHIKKPETPYSSRIGSQIALYTGIKYDFLRERRWRMGVSVRNGLGYCSAPFNDEDNIDNRIIGSHLNFLVGLEISATYRLAPQWSASLGVDLRHFSNGTIWQPNRGTNTIGASLTIGYDLTPQPLNQEVNDTKRPRTDFHKGFYMELVGGVGMKTIRQIFDYTLSDDLAVYAFPTLSGAVMYRYHKLNATGLALDYTYANYIYRIRDFEHDVRKKTGYDYSPHMLGLSLRHELTYHHLSLNVGLGAYVYRQGGYYGKEKDGPLYQAIGVRYALPFTGDRLFIGYQIKAHLFSKADCTQFVLGYRFMDRRLRLPK